MDNFLSSLAIVAVSQVPLLLKLWLDHRAATSGYKFELFRRQVDTFKELSTLLLEVHNNSEALITLAHEGTLPDEKDTEFAIDLKKSYLKDNTALINAVKDADFLLPAQLSVDLPKYFTCSTRLLFKAFGLPISSNESFKEIWSEQEVLYNSIVNQMRIALGIDTLSTDTQKMIHQNVDKTRLLLRSYKP